MNDIDPATVESHRQLVSAWSSIALDIDPDADLRELPGLRMTWAESRFVLWRSVTLTGTGSDAGELAVRLKEAVEVVAAGAPLHPRIGFVANTPVHVWVAAA